MWLGRGQSDELDEDTEDDEADVVAAERVRCFLDTGERSCAADSTCDAVDDDEDEDEEGSDEEGNC